MKKKNRITQIIIHIFLILACAVTIYPLLLCLGVSFTDEREVMNDGYKLIPHTFSIASYRYVFSAPKRIINAYKVTAFYSIVQTLLMLFFNSLMAYPLSRRNFRFRNKLNFYLYFTCLFSGGAVPVYILNTRYLHLNDTIWIYIIPGLVGAWTIFYIRTSFQAVPEEIVESAVMDGASEFRILLTFMMPLSKPVLATMALGSFLGNWNGWYTSLLYINKRSDLASLNFLLQEILMKITALTKLEETGRGQMVDITSIPSETVRMAMLFVVAGPALVVFPFFQKYFVKGMIVGSVKG